MTILLAPAKLTVSLEVTGVRSDGYHELDAEMVTLDLADVLEIDPDGSGVLVRADPAAGPIELPPSEDNLVARALRACGRRAGVELIKRIPVGGGLGGGSADAAAVLRWAGCDDPDVAVGIGADVPFCLAGGRARVQGIGERLTPLDFEPRHYVLVLPPFGVDTRAVYGAWDAGARSAGPNALTAAAMAVEPRLARWRDALGEYTGGEPTLAGSGSTWFVEVATPGNDEHPAPLLRAGGDSGRLVRARTVPAGWQGE